MITEIKTRRRLLPAMLLGVLLISLLLSSKASAANIHPYYYKGVMKRTVTVTSENGKKKKFKRKSKVVVKSRTKASKYTVYSGGETYKIRKKYIELVDLITDGKHPYTEEEATAYVNKKGFRSSTKYLIWVSTYKQHMYVFKGSKGKWSCIGVWRCTTGRFGTDTETPLGKMKIRGRQYEWVWNWNATAYYASRIKCGAIHSWVYKANGSKRSGHLGAPRSHGCIRVNIKRAKWIYYNIPRGTSVYVR